MKITEEILKQWSTQEKTELFSEAYHIVKDHILELPFVKDKQNQFDIYLQGWYANSTNIRKDSDVDIVLQYNGIFRYDNRVFTNYEQEFFNRYFLETNLTFEDYKNIIFTQLRDGIAKDSRINKIVKKAKSIKITLSNPKIEVDVVTCVLYKKYLKFSVNDPQNTNDYVEGIALEDTEEKFEIINYPKLHRENGEIKNSNPHTKGNFKVAVRYIKKIKALLVDEGVLSSDKAGSYFIENLIYNVPDIYFTNNKLETFKSILFCLENADLSKFKCQHHQWNLFGESSTQWNLNEAKYFICLLKKVFNGEIL